MNLDTDVVDAWAARIKDGLATVHDRIAAAGGNAQVLAVSKGQPIEAIVAAQQVGIGPLGENYAQALANKSELLDELGIEQPVWHFIGQLQTNKVRLIASRISVWQSVDRRKVAQEIAKRAPGATIFVQVNLSEDPDKGGCSFDDVEALVDDATKLGLDVGGLMGVGTAADEARTSYGFATLRAAVDRLSLPHCSMGMSADLELAVAAGATMVRVGTDVFGPRQ